MPLYVYRHPETGQTIEVVQSVHDEHKFFDKDDLEWKRVFTAPNVSVDAKVDPYSNSKFIEKTGNMKGTIGDMMDMSKELSEQRAKDNNGVDPIKQQFKQDYKARTGKDMITKESGTVKKNGVKIEY